MATDSKRRLPFHRRAFLLLISLSWALVACFILFQYVRERRYKVSSLDAVLQLENVHLLDMVEGRQGLDLAPLIEVDLPDTLRVTVIGFGGEVLYDSYNEASQANAVSENHRHRPEVEAALSSGSGYTIKRLSESTSERYFYSARRGRYAVMRTAVPYTYSLYSSLRADMGFLWFILAVAAIISIIGYFATRRLGRQIERKAEDCYKAEYARAHIGEHREGTISGVTQRGVFVELDNGVEGFVPVASLTATGALLTEGVRLSDPVSGKQWSLGDRMMVTIVRADVNLGKIDFEAA